MHFSSLECANLRDTTALTPLSVFKRRVDGQDSEKENRDREEEERPEAKRRVHEARLAEPCAGSGDWGQGGAADRGHQEAVGLYQEERAAGCKEPPDDQGRCRA